MSKTVAMISGHGAGCPGKFLAAIAVSMILMAGCDPGNAAGQSPANQPSAAALAKRSLLADRIAVAEEERSSLAFAVNSLTVNRSLLAAQLNQYQAQSERVRIDTKAYMMNHKMAVAVVSAGLAGGAVAFDPNNSFSDEAKGIGAVVGVVATFWALANLEEVGEVADRLVQADSHLQDLEAAHQRVAQQLGESDRALQTARNPRQRTPAPWRYAQVIRVSKDS